MKEFDPNEFQNPQNTEQQSDQHIETMKEDQSVSGSDVSEESSYFNHLHEEEAAAAEDSTYHYNYREQPHTDNQSDYIGYTPSNQDNSSRSSYTAYSKEEEKELKKQQKRREKAAKKAARKAAGGGKRRYVAKLIASALVFGLVAGAAFQGFNYCYYKVNPEASQKNQIQSTTTLTTSSDTVQTTTDLSEMVENVMPSIVSITSVIEQTINYGFWGQSGTQEAEGAGSGIIIGQNNSELLIVTNYHVIEDAKKISVAFCDSSDVEATVKGSDSDADLAVVAVPLSSMQDSTKSAIKVATLGKSSSLKVGEPAIAIGNALGYGQSVTAGYVSALDREVALTDKTMTLLQTDAAINPGNSGGALLNMKGEVIGINTVKYSDTTVEGMGYAIPIDTAYPIIQNLMNQETIPESKQAYLGITGSDVSESYSKQFNLPTGIYVQSVQEGSPAEKGGIYAGDIITKFDGNSVSTMENLINRLSNHQAGETITLTVKRMNQQGTFEEKELTITLGSKKDKTM